MRDFDRDEYPIFKPGHSTSTMLVCMFLGFALGLLACHKIYAGFDEGTFTLVDNP